MIKITSGILTLVLTVTLSGAERASTKKLIEFGWDEPDTVFLREHIAGMQRTPFDGCVFHVLATRPDGKKEGFMWDCWGKRTFTLAELQPALADLKATKFGRFKHNFLRFNSSPGNVDWFDDFTPVLKNAALAAHVAKEGGCPGLLFDDEAYTVQLFNYRKQRDAATKDWKAYAAQARLRGREVMEAFQTGYPDLVVFLTFGHSLPWKQSQGGKVALADCEYGLLAPFLDGMVEAARGRTIIVDGYELSYGFKKAAEFETAYQTMKEGVIPIVADPAKYQKTTSFGFGIWLDFKYQGHQWNDQDVTKNYFSPAELEASVGKALAVADEYVWIYSETPRWWSPEGRSVKVPGEYDAALRRAGAK